MPKTQQCEIWAASSTYITAHGNTRSLTQWVRPGIEPATSWMLVGFVNHCATTGTPIKLFFSNFLNVSRNIDSSGTSRQMTFWKMEKKGKVFLLWWELRIYSVIPYITHSSVNCIIMLYITSLLLIYLIARSLYLLGDMPAACRTSWARN